jgi:xanthine/CO dehydrogenase XdhC/CoxF family maturation factor
VLETGAPRLLRIDLTEDLFSWSPAVCGGVFDVFIERVAPAELDPGGGRRTLTKPAPATLVSRI